MVMCVGSCMATDNHKIKSQVGGEIMNTDSLSSCSFACSSCLTRLSASSARSSVSFNCWVSSLTLSVSFSSRAAAYGERKEGREEGREREKAEEREEGEEGRRRKEGRERERERKKERERERKEGREKR